MSVYKDHLIDPELRVTVTFVHKKRKRWAKWMEMGAGSWDSCSFYYPDEITTIIVYKLSWNAN